MSIPDKGADLPAQFARFWRRLNSGLALIFAPGFTAETSPLLDFMQVHIKHSGTANMLLNTSELPGVTKKMLSIAHREKKLSHPSDVWVASWIYDWQPVRRVLFLPPRDYVSFITITILRLLLLAMWNRFHLLWNENSLQIGWPCQNEEAGLKRTFAIDTDLLECFHLLCENWRACKHVVEGLRRLLDPNYLGQQSDASKNYAIWVTETQSLKW